MQEPKQEHLQVIVIRYVHDSVRIILSITGKEGAS